MSDPQPVILLVEESQTLTALVQRLLGQIPARIITAPDGLAGWRIFNREKVDLVVTDLVMPRMSGFELIRRIRQLDSDQQPYILVMTSLDQASDKANALDQGANDYVVKPLEPLEFRARIRTGLREAELRKELRKTLSILERELKLVSTLQRRLLPRRLPDEGRFRGAVEYRPRSQASGDYYYCGHDNQGRFLITVADGSGHGAQAAVLMAMYRVILNLSLNQARDAGHLLGLVNEALLEHIEQEQEFITAFLALVEPESHWLTYASAGHGDQFVLGPGQGQVKRLKSGGPVLGFFQYRWPPARLRLVPGQSLVLFTDGLIEATDPQGEELGLNRLEEFLKIQKPGIAPAELVANISGHAAAFAAGSGFDDDLTIFVTKYC